MWPWSGECGRGSVGDVLEVTIKLFRLLVRQKLPLLGRLNSFKPAVREGADCPRDWFLIRTRFDASPIDCQVTCPTLLWTLLDKGSSCLPDIELARLPLRNLQSS